MSSKMEQISFRVTPAFHTAFEKLADLEEGGSKMGLFKLLVRRAASGIIKKAVDSQVLEPGSWTDVFLTGERFDSALAASLTVLESKMAKAGDESDG